MFSMCSEDFLLPRNRSETFLRNSSECFTPSGEPAVGDMLYSGLRLSSHHCSRCIRASGSQNSRTSKTKTSGPFLFQEFCRCRELCAPLRSRDLCPAHLRRNLTALPM